MNTSASGGYLAPTTPVPVNDLDLDIVFQSLFAWLTGLSSDFVRPRFQPEPPVPPAAQSTWIAVGVMSADDDQYPVQLFESDAAGLVMIRHETIDVLCSFYGPHAGQALRTARDGLLLNQNNEAIQAAGITYAYAGRITRVPSLVKSLWLNRLDATFTFRRQIVEAYPILSLTSAAGVTTTQTGLTVPFSAT